jgi:NADP-dependent aldehyde dehydrogenase
MSPNAVASIDARTGQPGNRVARETPAAEIAQLSARAVVAAAWLVAQGREGRARLLNALADGLESRSDEIVAMADRESALGVARLTGELGRTCFQLRFMGEVAHEGSYLDVSIDHAGESPMGWRPDLRRINLPLGPVAVFGASNFPLAFSTPGGDTASALAAGCPVIVKAHPSHAGTSVLVDEIFRNVLGAFGAPEGIFALVFGREAGISLVTDPNIAAVGFTGSLAGGRALFNAACSREVPIPFYGELGRVNPLVVTDAAAEFRALDIGLGIAGSMTQGNGQFCTKPGLYLVPDSEAGARVVDAIVEALAAVSPTHMLNDGIRDAYRSAVARVTALDDVTALFAAQGSDREVAPLLVEISTQVLAGENRALLIEEHFGPFGVVIRYRNQEELAHVLAVLPPALTGTVHTTGASDPQLSDIVRELVKRSGRIVFNGYPTGVAVSWSMHHGGQYPAATSTSTSVGSNAISRWLRTVVYQDAPLELLPTELHDELMPGLARRIDGKLQIG